MGAMRPKEDIALTVCLFAARMDVGGLFATEGKEVATSTMKRLLQLLTGQRVIINWRSLSVGPEETRCEVYVSPANGYFITLPTASLTPENESALKVMLG